MHTTTLLIILTSKRARALQRGNKIMFCHLSQLLHLVIVINLFILLPFWKFPFALLQLLLCTRSCGFHHHTEQMPVRKERRRSRPTLSVILIIGASICFTFLVSTINDSDFLVSGLYNQMLLLKLVSTSLDGNHYNCNRRLWCCIVYIWVGSCTWKNLVPTIVKGKKDIGYLKIYSTWKMVLAL